MPVTFQDWVSKQQPGMLHVLPGLSFEAWLQQRGLVPASQQQPQPQQKQGDDSCPPGYTVLKDGTFSPVL